MRNLVILSILFLGLTNPLRASSDTLIAKDNTEVWCSDNGLYRLILIDSYTDYVYLYSRDSLINFYTLEGLDLTESYVEDPEEIALTDLMFQYGITKHLKLVDPNDYVEFRIKINSQREERVHLCSRDRMGHMMLVTRYEHQIWYKKGQEYSREYRTHANFVKGRTLNELKATNAWLDVENHQLIIFEWGTVIATIDL